MAYFEQARPYDQVQANPYGAFVQGEAQANQLAQQQQAVQSNKLALLQQQQQMAQQNQLATLAPQIYTTTDPTQRAQLQGELAAQGPDGQKAALTAQVLWTQKSAAQKQALATAADQAARYAFTASQTADPTQKQTLLDQAYQVMQATGAPPSHIQSLRSLDPDTQIKAITAGAMSIKDLAAQETPDLSKVVTVNASDGSTHQMIPVNGRLVPIGQYVAGQSQAQPTAPNTTANLVKPYDTSRISQIIAQVNQPSPYDPIIQQAAQANGLDPRMLKAQLIAESGLNPNAANSQSVGIAQFTPATAKGMGIDPSNPQQSIMGAAKLLAQNGGQTAQGFGNYYGGTNPAQHGPNTQQYVANMEGVQAALKSALDTMAQPVQAPQGGQPQQGTSQPGGMNNDQLGAAQQKLLALQQQAGHPLTPTQLLQSTGASPQMIQQVIQAAGLNPNLPIDVRNPDAAQALFKGMIAAAQQSPHLLPQQAQAALAKAQGGVQAPATTQQPVATPAPVEFGVKPAGSSLKPPAGYRFAADGKSLEAIPGGPADKSALTQGLGDPNMTGQAFLASIPDAGMRNMIQAISDGRQQIPRIYRSGKAGEIGPTQIAEAVSQYDPSFNAGDYDARIKTRNDFTSGKSAVQVNALNTVGQHLNALMQDAQALNNSGIPAWNSVVNTVESKGLGDPRVTQFNLARDAVAKELERVWRGTGGSETGIQQWMQDLSSSSSPQQFQHAIGQLTDLINGKLQALKNQYLQGMGQARNPLQLLAPQTQEVFQRLDPQDAAAYQSAATATPAIGSQAPSGWSIQKVGQ